MIKVSGIKVPAGAAHDSLISYAAKTLGIRERDILRYKILKRSIDSRKKPQVFFIYTLAVELREGVHFKGKFEKYVPEKYRIIRSEKKPKYPPVVVGMGPGGLFAALTLAEAGIPCIVIERGRDVDRRSEDVRRFWETGKLDTTSNVQFGEGGAGTFSDGKLMTGTSDRRIGYAFERFVEFGAPEDILYLAKPHIGTDKLKIVVKNMRQHLIALGCDVRFEEKLVGFNADDNGLKSVLIENKDGVYELKTNHMIMALGNGARDTFTMLHENGLEMEAKSFAVGVRIEHLQRDVDMSQYGEAATLGTLPASDYKLAVHLAGGRGVFTFCVCPGGQVVAAASEHGGVVTNGMSEYARDRENINGGLLVSVTPEDFDGLFGGIEFQRQLEKSAFTHGGGTYAAPCQRVADFLAKRSSTNCGKVKPSYKPNVKYCNLWDVLPEFICQAISEALPMMEKKIKGFSQDEALLTAVETRSSCPIRIKRDESFESNINGIYPCGEGAGYAGGITTSAVDGIKCGEAVIKMI